jgi:hypothetical protein
MTKRRNPDAQGINWDRDDYIIRDITPGRIAIYENVDRQVVIMQGNHHVSVGRRDLGELMHQLYRLACEMGYEPPPLPKPPARLFALPNGMNGGGNVNQ